MVLKRLSYKVVWQDNSPSSKGLTTFTSSRAVQAFTQASQGEVTGGHVEEMGRPKQVTVQSYPESPAQRFRGLQVPESPLNLGELNIYLLLRLSVSTSTDLTLAVPYRELQVLSCSIPAPELRPSRWESCSLSPLPSGMPAARKHAWAGTPATICHCLIAGHLHQKLRG